MENEWTSGGHQLPSSAFALVQSSGDPTSKSGRKLIKLIFRNIPLISVPLFSFESFQRVKWSGLLLMVGIVTTLGIAVPVGYNIGVINSTGELITEWIKTVLMDRNDTVPTDVGLDLLWSTVVAIFLVGGAVGSLGGAWVADRLGR